MVKRREQLVRVWDRQPQIIEVTYDVIPTSLVVAKVSVGSIELATIRRLSYEASFVAVADELEALCVLFEAPIAARHVLLHDGREHRMETVMTSYHGAGGRHALRGRAETRSEWSQGPAASEPDAVGGDQEASQTGDAHL